MKFFNSLLFSPVLLLILLNWFFTSYSPGDKNSTESDFLVISENLRFFSISQIIQPILTLTHRSAPITSTHEHHLP